jgi:hypothetical protein
MRRAAAALSVLLFALGLVILIETAVLGGELGYLIGALFLLAGGGRMALRRLV